MNCNCKEIYPESDKERWESCPSSIIANADNYYTKHQVDDIIEDITISGGGISSGEAQTMIDDSIAQIDIPTVPTNVSAFVNDVPYLVSSDLSPLESSVSALSGNVVQLSTQVQNKADKSEIPSLNGYATEQWVENKHYLTQHQPLKTINNESLIGTGNITIEGGGTITIDDSLSPNSDNAVANSAITNAINDVMASIPTVPTNVSAFNNDVPYLTQHQSLSGYATEQWVENKNYISDADLSDYATEEWVENKHYITGVDLSNYATKQEIPTVPTNVSAFNNDAHYVTSATTKALIDAAVSGKAATSSVTAVNNVVTAHTGNSTIHITQQERNYWNAKVDSSSLSNYVLKSNIWCGTETQYNAITVKNPDTIYMIYDE